MELYEIEKRIKILDGPLAGKKFKIVGKKLTIGRAPTNTIILESDSVSRSHAAIYTENNALVIEDLDSKNGVFINGRQIRKHTLASGDKIKIGTTIMEYLEVNPAEAKQEESQDNEIGMASPQKKKFNLPNLFKTHGNKSEFGKSNQSGANKKRAILYGILGLTIIFALAVQKGWINLSSSNQPANESQEKTKDSTTTVQEQINKDYLNIPDVVLKKDNTKPDVDKLYAKALLLHDISQLNEAIKILEYILSVEPQNTKIQIKRTEWLNERSQMGTKILEQALRAYENRYFEESKKYFRQLLLLIPEKENDLNKQAAQGIESIDKILKRQ